MKVNTVVIVLCVTQHVRLTLGWEGKKYLGQDSGMERIPRQSKAFQSHLRIYGIRIIKMTLYNYLLI